LKRLISFLRRVLLPSLFADDLEHLVEGVVDLLEALEDVQALLDLLQVELEAPGDDLEAEIEEVAEDALQIEPLRRPHLRVVGRHQAGQVHAEVRRKGVCL